MIRHKALALLLALAALVKAQPDKGLVARYTFNDGRARNESGSGQPKALGTSFVEDRFGNDAAAAYLHGNFQSYINLGTDSILKPKQGSISMWVNIDVFIYKGEGEWDYNPILITKCREGYDFNEGYFMGVNFHTGKLNITTAVDQNKSISLNTRRALPLQKWHHVVMTYDDDSMALYLNNRLEARLPKNFRTFFLKGDSVMIGNTASKKNERCLCGAIDDIHIYNRVISPEEVSELYHAPDPNRSAIYLRWLYAFLLFAFLVTVVVWFISRKLRNNLWQQKEKNRLNAHLNELETKAIRTQMNPHFIFNSLNTLQRFILEEDIVNANSYLIKFSKLLRRLLESSASESISLKEEIEILKSYFEIEKLRFDKLFEFNLSSNIPDTESVHIPFMLIQPFVENAIWHGLLPKKGHCQLNVTFSDIDAKTLLCCVDDNGVGRNYSVRQKDPFRKKSMAIDFVKQRLDILEKATGIKCSVTIVDKTDESGQSTGTLVKIVVPKIK